jgi:hypothetical protein
MKYSRADHQIERSAQIGDVLDWKLVQFQVFRGGISAGDRRYAEGSSR